MPMISTGSPRVTMTAWPRSMAGVRKFSEMTRSPCGKASLRSRSSTARPSSSRQAENGAPALREPASSCEEESAPPIERGNNPEHEEDSRRGNAHPLEWNFARDHIAEIDRGNIRDQHTKRCPNRHEQEIVVMGGERHGGKLRLVADLDQKERDQRRTEGTPVLEQLWLLAERIRKECPYRHRQEGEREN